MKLPQSLLFLSFLPFLVSADSAYQAPLASQSLLLDIAKQSSQIYAVGERGHILHSTDGESWQQQQVPTLATLTAVDLVGEHAWAVGHDAAILHKAPGQEWQVQMQQPALEKPFLDVLFLDEKHGIAIGAYGLFYRTTDGGKRWQAESHPELLHSDDQAYLEEIRLEDEEFYQEELASILPHLNRVTQAGDRLYMAGESGLLAYSEDQGHKWQRMEIDYEGSFFDIRQIGSRLLAAGLRGNLFEYDQQAEHWQAISTQDTSTLNSIIQTANEQIWVLGNNGKIVKLNGDQAKVEQQPDSKALLNAVSVGDTLIAVGSAGISQLK